MTLHEAEQRIEAARQLVHSHKITHKWRLGELREAEQYAAGAANDEPETYARRTRLIDEPREACQRARAQLAEAEAELQAAEVAAQGPRTAAFEAEAEQLAQLERQIAQELRTAIPHFVALSRSTTRIRSALERGAHCMQRMASLATLIRFRGEPSAGFVRVRERAQQLLRAAPFKPDAIVDGSLRAEVQAAGATA